MFDKTRLAVITRELEREDLGDEQRSTLERQRDDQMRARLLTMDDDRHIDRAPGSQRNENPTRDTALRTIERHGDVLTARAADRLDRLVRKDDPTGIGARYLAAVGSDAYASAFVKLLKDPTLGFARFSSAERDAMEVASKVQSERAMSEGTSGDGGFAVPFALDATVILANDGVTNPLRSLATVSTVVTSVWKGVSSTGVVASYQSEGTPATDDSPTLLQPTVYVEKAHAFIPFSIEVGQDWAGLTAELARMFADAKESLEAEMFLSGAGHASSEPEGLLVGATETVETKTASTFQVDDCYSVVQAVPSRYQSNNTVLGNPAVFDAAYRFIGGGSEEPAVLPTREGPFLGRRKAEYSAMSMATGTPGESILIAGDFRAGFRVIERIGMNVELIPLLFGATFTPTGQRGLYAYWRNGAGVVVPNALRVLVVKAP
jgi:HK97 family phage major capsid protein